MSINCNNNTGTSILGSNVIKINCQVGHLHVGDVPHGPMSEENEYQTSVADDSDEENKCKQNRNNVCFKAFRVLRVRDFCCTSIQR